MGRSGDFVETVEIAGSVAVVAPHAQGCEDIAFREHANNGHVGAAVLTSRIVGARRLGAGIDAHGIRVPLCRYPSYMERPSAILACA